MLIYHNHTVSGKRKQFNDILRKHSTQVKYLGQIPGMKFLMDENCQVNFDDKTITNTRTFFERMGLRPFGHSDNKILKEATKQDYTIVTRDKNLIVKAFNQRISIIYCEQFIYDIHYYLVEN